MQNLLQGGFSCQLMLPQKTGKKKGGKKEQRMVGMGK